MRLDRFITLNLVRPWHSVFRSRPALDPRLPVLMYHSISRRDERHVPDYFKLCTPPERFRLQLETLKENGYLGTDLETGLARLAAGSLKDNRTVAITFDDGFRDFYLEALPILIEHGFTATMYLPTSFIREERQTFKAVECLTWSEVRECQKHGIRFGSHTRTHPKLCDLAWPDVETEVRDSRHDLVQQLGTPVTSLAYPYAFPEGDRAFCKRFRQTLVTSGYQTCVTTIAGRVSVGDEPYTLRRLPVNGEDGPPLLLAKLKGDYDWIQAAQRSVKCLRRIFTPVSLARGSSG